MKRLLFLIGLSLTLRCSGSNAVPSHTPSAVVDTDLCELAGVHLESLSCVTNPYTKRGKRFGLFCQEVQGSGIYLNPRCLSTITSCSEVPRCTSTSL